LHGAVEVFHRESDSGSEKSTKAAQSPATTHHDDAATHQFCSTERTDLVPGKWAENLSDQFFSLFFIRLCNAVATVFGCKNARLGRKTRSLRTSTMQALYQRHPQALPLG
jgi:hypothetical protein